jgi:restriction system protein
MAGLPWDNNSWEVAAAQIVAAQKRQFSAAVGGFTTVIDTPLALRTSAIPQLMMQTIIIPGDKTSEGVLIEAVSLPWFAIIEEVLKNPAAALQIDPRKWEEIVAGAYVEAGFDEVTLTPRSGDHGRDVIAIKKAHGIVRVIDQVKAYAPGNLVPANDVRALMGVLHLDPASKGFVSTTSDFAPGIATDPLIAPLIPSRLDLINWEKLRAWLEKLAHN